MLKLLIAVMMLAANVNAELNTIVYIKNGALQGKIYSDKNGKDFVAFQSVPYAKPPMGKLRFKAPEEPDNWSGIKEATKNVPSCLQNTGLGKEDCLYLNVYTPEPSNDTDFLKPVMFFVHGGRFNSGSSSMLNYGPQYLITEDIVLVTINYRLGALGFLSFDDQNSGISSNNGLKDQVMALKWVRENIAQFGGNPKMVTIFGESAGAATVHMLVLSPMAKDLFQAAIIQSGTAITTWANGLPNSAIPFAEALGIDTNNTENLLEELQKASTKEIFAAQQSLSFSAKGFELTIGQPTIERPGPASFLSDHPRNILKSGNFTNIPMMMGYNNQEGILYDLRLLVTNQKYSYNGTELIPYYFDFNKSQEINALQLDYYFGGIPPTEGKNVIDLWTDLWYKYDVVNSAQKHSDYNRSDVYLYEFSMDTELNILKKMHPVTATYPGAAHSDELGYLFHQILTTIQPESIEDLCIRRMVRLWANFAKFGNPTPIEDALLDNLLWLPYKPNQTNYIGLGNELEIYAKYTDRGYQFWQYLYADYDVFEYV